MGRNKTRNGMVFYIKMSADEANALIGYIDNLHIIPTKNTGKKIRIYERGRNKDIKYFLIPKELKRSIDLKKEAFCIRTECKDKVVFSYIMNKYWEIFNKFNIIKKSIIDKIY